MRKKYETDESFDVVNPDKGDLKSAQQNGC